MSDIIAIDDRPRPRPARRLPLLACAGCAVAGIGLAARDVGADADPRLRPTPAEHVTADRTVPGVEGAGDLRLIDAAASVHLAAAGTIALGAGLAFGRTRRTSRS